MSNPAVDFPWEKLYVDETMTVHTGKCVLHAIQFNGMTVAGTVNVIDGVDAGGTQIGLLRLTPAVQISCQPITLKYDCEMADGIHLIFTTFVGNLTVMYK